MKFSLENREAYTQYVQDRLDKRLIKAKDYSDFIEICQPGATYIVASVGFKPRNSLGFGKARNGVCVWWGGDTFTHEPTPHSRNKLEHAEDSFLDPFKPTECELIAFEAEFGVEYPLLFCLKEW